MFLVTSPIDINEPTRGLLAVETMHAIVQWVANLNIKRFMTSMFVNKKHRSTTQLFFAPLVIQLVWYILKQLFTSVSVKGWIFTKPRSGLLISTTIHLHFAVWSEVILVISKSLEKEKLCNKLVALQFFCARWLRHANRMKMVDFQPSWDSLNRVWRVNRKCCFSRKDKTISRKKTLSVTILARG